MRRSKSMTPKVEGLESLVFLSVAANPAAAAARAALAQQQRAAEVARPTAEVANPDLSGSARGNYRLQLAADGSSGSFQIQGIGQVRGLGPTRVASNYSADQSSAPETMSMTLTNRRGSLTLQVGRAPGDVDPNESTARLRYQVVSGTGPYARSTGSGVLDLTLRPQSRTFGASGQMSLTLRPDAA